MKIADIMKARFAVVLETAGIGSVESDMSMNGMRNLLVVDDQGRLTGIISRADVMHALDKGARGSIVNHMTRRLWTAHLGDDATRAADLMLENHIAAVPVVDDASRPVGLIVEADLLRIARTHLAEHVTPVEPERNGTHVEA